MALLAKDGLHIRIFTPECCQLFLCDFNVFSPILESVPFAKLFSQQLELTFRTPGKFGVRTITGAPATINVSIPHTHVEWIVAHLDLGYLDSWIAHRFTPVVQVIHAHPDPRLNLCRSFAGRRERRFEEGIIVVNELVSPLPILFHAQFIGITRRHAKGWMPKRIIFLISPLLDSLCQSRERPHSLATWISHARILAWMLNCLRISKQVIEKLCLHGTKQTFLGRAKPWLSSRALMFAHAIQGQQLLEVDALKFWPAVNCDRCREPPVALHAETKNHEARTIAWRIKRERVGCDPSRMGKDQQGQPAFPQRLTSSRIAKNQIEFGMIQMSHGPGVAAMPTHCLLLFTNVVLEWIGSAGSFACYCLLICSFVAAHFEVKRFLIDGVEVLFLRALEILSIGSSFGFARDRVVMRLKHTVDERDDFTANFSLTTTIVIARKEAEKAASVVPFGLSVSFLPALPRSRGDSRALVPHLRLFLIVVELRMNDTITEESRSKINIAGAFEEFSTFRRNARDRRRLKRGQACISVLHAHVSRGARQKSRAEDRCM